MSLHHLFSIKGVLKKIWLILEFFIKLAFIRIAFIRNFRVME
jgi:hypothetical protein